MKNYQLLKDLFLPWGTYEAGTVKTAQEWGQAIGNLSEDDFMRNHSYWGNGSFFQEVNEKRWTDDDMMIFAYHWYCQVGNGIKSIKEVFSEWAANRIIGNDA